MPALPHTWKRSMSLGRPRTSGPSMLPRMWQPPPVGDGFDRLAQEIGATESQVAIDDPPLGQLHGTGDSGTGGDGVQPQFVAEVFGLGDGLQIGDAAGCPQRPERLLLRSPPLLSRPPR